MSEVALKIGGRTYRVACAAGEEDRVKRLGKTIDEIRVELRAEELRPIDEGPARFLRSP